MTKITPTRLYIKRHSITGLKYFGKSIKQNIEKYNGSGKYWKKHIEKHGKQFVVTEWISEWFYTKEEIENYCKIFCKKYNIINNTEWANLKEETGLDGGILPDYALQSLKNKLKGRNKNTHDYIKKAAIKKSITMKNPNGKYQTEGIPKIKKWVNSLTENQRKNIFGHTCSEQQKQKLSLERIGKNKNNCDRVKKMSDTKKKFYSNLNIDEKKKLLGKSKGYKWYHNDILCLCKTFSPNNIPEGWSIGRKKYENKEN